MIRIAIDLITFTTGSEGQRLYTVEVTNDGTGTPVVGNYDVVLRDSRGNALESTRLTDWPRHMNAWEMLKRIVKLFAGRKGNA